MIFEVSDVPILKAAGKGVTGMKLRDGDEIMAFELGRGSLEGPEVTTSFGRELVVRERKFGVSKRGGRGKVVLTRGTIDRWARTPTVLLAKGNDLAEEDPDDADVPDDHNDAEPASTDHDGEE